ncbi:hypothetical protein ACP4OV_010991 [Aristida adscensionis]
MAGGSTAGALKFTVRRRPAVLVPPAAPTPRELKRLSDIDDQETLRVHLPFILFFRHNAAASMAAAGRDPASVIRDSLARALVHYHPLAGRMRELGGRKLAVDCTGEGVLFIEADADVSLEHFRDPLLPPFMELIFDVPGSSAIVNSPLLLIQVTRLPCGDFVLGVRLMHHGMFDGPGFLQFMGAMAELARGASEPTVPPVWRRELLQARDPPRPRFAHREYDDDLGEARARGATPPLDLGDTLHRSFVFWPRDIAALRGHLPPRLRSSATAFDILIGCLWKHRTAALAPDAGEEMRMICAVNARGGSLGGAGIPRGYYGNAFAFAVAVSTAGKLCASPLGYAVELVKKAKGEVDMEYMRSVADLMVLRGRPSIAPANAYVVSDVTQAGRTNLDFGWGRPAYAAPTMSGVFIHSTGFSFLLPFTNGNREEGIAVPVCLPRDAMARFEQEMGKLLQHPPIDVAAQRQPRAAL